MGCFLQGPPAPSAARGYTWRAEAWAKRTRIVPFRGCTLRHLFKNSPFSHQKGSRLANSHEKDFCRGTKYFTNFRIAVSPFTYRSQRWGDAHVRRTVEGGLGAEGGGGGEAKQRAHAPQAPRTPRAPRRPLSSGPRLAGASSARDCGGWQACGQAPSGASATHGPRHLQTQNKATLSDCTEIIALAMILSQYSHTYSKTKKKP